jgi:hypothetical protein
VNLTRRNIRTEELAATINALTGGSRLSAAISAVYQRAEMTAPWRFIMGRCVLGDRQDIPPPEFYRDSAFVAATMPDMTIELLINALSTDGWVLGDDLPPLKITVTNPSWSEETIPSDEVRAPFPRRQYSARIDQEGHFVETQLVAYGKPYGSSSAKRLKEFLGLSQFHGNSDGRRGELMIDVSDRRGAISLRDGRLSIAGTNADLCLVGEINGETPVNLMGPQTQAIDGAAVRTAELWLVNKENEVLDFRSSTEWPHRYEPGGESTSYRDDIKDAIAAGESETCEFKPYVDLNDKEKRIEIEKTVCAFSNTKGGQIFLGVDDEGEVIGLTRSLAKRYGANAPDHGEAYAKNIRALLRETLKDNQCFTVDPVSVYGSTIIVIDVQRSLETNYLLNSSQPFIRRGATSMKMAPPVVVSQATSNRPNDSLWR